MSIQYFIVSAIVVFIVLLQYKSFLSIKNRIDKIRNLFPSSSSNNQVVKDGNKTTILCDSTSPEFKNTVNDINSYLEKNENKTFDYHILKEIVDRNSKSLEDEVDTMISVPLYWGLVATIFGIAFGIVLFAWNDLANLISGTEMSVDGIKILLTDVGIAMVASLAGVLITKIATTSFNDARTEMAKNKNTFLTWIQTDLMSKLSDDITGALIKMTNDLNDFNRTFASNTKELKETLSMVKDNYEGQVKLLDAIEKIKITKIAKANIQVYDKLQGCTEELERLFEIFANSNDYLEKVVELNGKIGSVEERTQLFENLGNYFKNEIEYVKDRQGLMRQQMAGIDSVLQDGLNELGTSLIENLHHLREVFQQQNQGIQELIEEQQRALSSSLEAQQQTINDKIGQIENPFAGLKETFEEGITGIKAAFAAQNETITEMLNAQNATFEEALKSQQNAILKKFQEGPNQLKALSDIASTLEKLNKSIDKNADLGNNDDETHQKKSKIDSFMRYLLPIGTCGTFLALLALIAILLFDIKL